MNQMWSFVGNKKQERWLWQTIDHQTGEILAYVLAAHVDVALKGCIEGIDDSAGLLRYSLLLHGWLGSYRQSDVFVLDDGR